MDGYQDEAAEFNPEDVETIVKQAIVGALNENSYSNKKVNEWTNNIVAQCLKNLQDMGRPFKYIITCVIMQKNGAGLCTSSTQLWDGNRDGMCKVPWSNLTMSCLVTVYGLSVNIEDPHDLDM
jgi:dynein light chain Tctex-type 1